MVIEIEFIFNKKRDIVFRKVIEKINNCNGRGRWFGYVLEFIF